jgi:anti-sigma-K factor RskA
MSDIPCEHSGDAVGWVLGALPPEQAERFAAHLETCPACRAEVARLTEASERLADAAPLLTPPPELRDRVMASVRAETGLFDAARADPHSPEAARRRGRSRRRAAGLTAAVATLAVVIAAVVLLTVNHASHHVVARTVIGKVTARGGGARARAVVRIQARTATLIVTRLAAPPAGRVYQAWVVRRGLPPKATGALFSVPRSGNTRILLPKLRGVTEVIVTAEPPRGSSTPTLPAIVLVQLSPRPGDTALKP